MSRRRRRRYTVEEWYYDLNGEEIGPVTNAEIGTLIADGTVTAATSVCGKGQNDWKPAAESRLAIHFQQSPSQRLPIKDPSFRPVGGFSIWLRISLVLYVIVTVALIGLNLFTWFNRDAFYLAEVGSSDASPLMIGITIMLAFAALLYGLSFFSSVIAYCWLFPRCMRNLRETADPHATMSPAETWAWYIVPIASLFKPWEAMANIWRGTMGQIGQSTKLPTILGIWWFAWLGSTFADIVSSITDGLNGPKTFIQDYDFISYAIAQLPLVFAIIAAVMLFRLAGQITDGQKQLIEQGAFSVFD